MSEASSLHNVRRGYTISQFKNVLTAGKKNSCQNEKGNCLEFFIIIISRILWLWLITLMLITSLLSCFMYLYIWQSNWICSLINVKSFTVSRIYSIRSNIRFMSANLININGIFVHKSLYVSLMERSLVKTLKFSCANDISKNGWYRGIEILLKYDHLNYAPQY